MSDMILLAVLHVTGDQGSDPTIQTIHRLAGAQACLGMRRFPDTPAQSSRVPRNPWFISSFVVAVDVGDSVVFLDARGSVANFDSDRGHPGLP